MLHYIINRRCLAGLVSKYTPMDFEGKKRRITCIDYRPDGQEILVSYSSDYIYIFDPNENDETRTTKLYVGRRKQQKDEKPVVRDRSPPPMKRLRLRGDWSDTGPNARPENNSATNTANDAEDEAASSPPESANVGAASNDSPSRHPAASVSGASGSTGEIDQTRELDEGSLRTLREQGARAPAEDEEASPSHQPRANPGIAKTNIQFYL